MKTNKKTEDARKTFREVDLPDELKIVSAIQVRASLPFSEASLWRADKAGELPRLRVGKRAYYRVTDLRAFLNRAQHRPPVAVPFGNQAPAT